MAFSVHWLFKYVPRYIFLTSIFRLKRYGANLLASRHLSRP